MTLLPPPQALLPFLPGTIIEVDGVGLRNVSVASASAEETTVEDDEQQALREVRQVIDAAKLAKERRASGRHDADLGGLAALSAFVGEELDDIQARGHLPPSSPSEMPSPAREMPSPAALALQMLALALLAEMPTPALLALPWPRP